MESDEDSEDDEPRPGATKHLTRFQLMAQSRIMRAQTVDASGDEEETEIAVPTWPKATSRTRSRPVCSGGKPKYTFRLTKRIDSVGLRLFPEPNYLKYKDFNPAQLFDFILG